MIKVCGFYSKVPLNMLFRFLGQNVVEICLSACFLDLNFHGRFGGVVS